MKEHRYEMSRAAQGGAWSIVLMRQDGRELWAGSGYLTRTGARRAARRVLRAQTTANPSGVQTLTGTL